MSRALACVPIANIQRHEPTYTDQEARDRPVPEHGALVIAQEVFRVMSENQALECFGSFPAPARQPRERLFSGLLRRGHTIDHGRRHPELIDRRSCPQVPRLPRDSHDRTLRPSERVLAILRVHQRTLGLISRSPGAQYDACGYKIYRILSMRSVYYPACGTFFHPGSHG